MYKVSEEAVRQRMNTKVLYNGGFAICDLPIAVSSHCPYCKEKVVFKCHDWTGDPSKSISSNSECASCQEKPVFISVGFFQTGNIWFGRDLYIYPGLEQKRALVSDIETSMPENLIRAYKAAIDTYNVGLWNPAVVAARRVLEGITKTSLPKEEQNQSLYKQIETLSKHIDLELPIKQIGHSLRTAGNLGAHFDLEKEADIEIASIMFDLLDYLIEYIYAIPNRVKILEERITKEERDASQQ
ncbi:DUF4145 domain-containing protein [Hymenobacter sp. UYP22]|uniref:DUF4145 domain-containing protein n=1 Tax=Hymenobacter sp. UYP22 TaxID=3156348 RepID=UPI0033983812